MCECMNACMHVAGDRWGDKICLVIVPFKFPSEPSLNSFCPRYQRFQVIDMEGSKNGVTTKWMAEKEKSH